MCTDCQMQIFTEIRPAEAVEELVELYQTFGNGKVLVKQGECFHSRLLQNDAGLFGQTASEVSP